MAGLLYNRMHNLNISGNCDNKIYHYCYVCNTQLNSCKQALLHCSGKRHRKKLQFLQARKGQFGGGLTTAAPDDTRPPSHFPSPLAAPPLPATAGHIGPLPGAPVSLVAANTPTAAAAAGPTLVATMATGHSLAQPNSAPSGGCFYPYMPPMEHWLAPMAAVPPAFVHFHGHFGPVPVPHYQQQAINGHVPAAIQHLPPHLRAPRPSLLHTSTCPQVQPRPLLRYHESLRSTESSSPILLTDVSAFGSGNSSADARSFLISPSETSSISSESLISPTTRIVYRCHVCQRQFITSSQLQVHLQTSRHSKQCVAQTGGAVERAGDSSEAESCVSSSSIYYCMLCNIAVNSPTQLEAHTASHKHKQVAAANAHHRTESRSSSTSSETVPVEIFMDSGYVSGSSDELICISHPTPEKPTAKFRCQICNIFLNSPSQAKQHLDSQKHRQRVSCIRPVVRRKSASNFKRKQSSDQQQQKAQPQSEEGSALVKITSPEAEDGGNVFAGAPFLDTPSTEEVDEADERGSAHDSATVTRCCHSL